MKKLVVVNIIVFLVQIQAFAVTLFQCAGDIVGRDGVRVNIVESDGRLRANLIFGTTVSGT